MDVREVVLGTLFTSCCHIPGDCSQIGFIYIERKKKGPEALVAAITSALGGGMNIIFLLRSMGDDVKRCDITVRCACALLKTQTKEVMTIWTEQLIPTDGSQKSQVRAVVMHGKCVPCTGDYHSMLPQQKLMMLPPAKGPTSSYDYDDLWLLHVRSASGHNVATDKLTEVWIMLTSGSAQPKDLRNHLIVGTHGLITDGITPFSKEYRKLMQSVSVSFGKSKGVVTLHQNVGQVCDHTSLNTFSTQHLRLTVDVPKIPAILDLDDVVTGSPTTTRINLKQVGLCAYATLTHNFRVKIEAKAPGHHQVLPVFDVTQKVKPAKEKPHTDVILEPDQIRELSSHKEVVADHSITKEPGKGKVQNENKYVPIEIEVGKSNVLAAELRKTRRAQKSVGASKKSNRKNHSINAWKKSAYSKSGRTPVTTDTEEYCECNTSDATTSTPEVPTDAIEYELRDLDSLHALPTHGDRGVILHRSKKPKPRRVQGSAQGLPPAKELDIAAGEFQMNLWLAQLHYVRH